jgi:PAS domain S-box-containing protein
MAFGDSAEELKQLQRCMSDLVSVLALPAVWSGQDPRQIVATLHDALMTTLNPGLLYTRVRINTDEELIEELRTAPHYATTHNVEQIHNALQERFGGDPRNWPAVARIHLGGQETSLVSMHLGIEGEFGFVLAGSERTDFPTQSERLLMGVVANQITVGLQQARLLSEQKRIAGELDRRVAERTKELDETNEELQLQVGLLQHLPVSTWTLKPDGTPDFVNRVWLEFSGQTLDFARSHPEAWMIAVHPEDREAASKAFGEGVRSGQGFAFETRSLRAQDGTYRWHLQQAVALRDAEGNILKFVGTTTDIDDRKRAEEELRASETNLRQIVDSIPGLICAMNPAGQIELANQPLMDYFGMTVDELNSWGTNGGVHADDLPHVIAEFGHSMTTGTPYENELRCRRADGVYRWFQNRILPVRDKEGRITGWYGLLTDIEDRKRAEEALRASEISLRQTLDTIPGLVSKANSNGMIELANPQLLTYFGKTTEEINSWSTSDVVHPDDLPRVTAEITHSFKTGTPFDSELRYRRADGVHRWFQARSLPFRGADGEVAGWYFLLTDIEDRKRAEEALRESEHESRLIVDSIPGLIAVIDTSGEVERVSQPLLNYLGKSLDELRQWAVDDTIHPDDRPTYLQAFERSFAAGEPLEYEATRVRRFDGVYRWLNIRGLPLRDRQGHIVRWYFLLTDVDDRKRAEDELRRSEARHRVVVETASDAVVSIDDGGAIILANPAIERIFGYNPGELIGKPLTILMPEAMRKFHEAGLKRYLETGERRLNWQGTEMTAQRANGEEFPAEVSFGEMAVDQRKVFTGFIRDISEKKRAEQALLDTQAELSRMMRVMSIGQLTASIAHEVSQPLSGIIINASTCLRMLKSDPPNIDVALETVQRAIRDSNRASEVISRLRALFSKKQMNAEPLDLNELAREVIALLSGELERNNVILTNEFSDDLPAVHCDRVQLQEVILNLLRNASDAMSSIEDRPRQMVLKTEMEDGHVRFLVRDSGVGFTPEVANQMFESFYTTKSDGMGVGLSISRSIIEANRGRIWATVNDGPGATFAFSIPCEHGPRSQDGP